MAMYCNYKRIKLGKCLLIFFSEILSSICYLETQILNTHTQFASYFLRVTVVFHFKGRKLTEGSKSVNFTDYLLWPIKKIWTPSRAHYSFLNLKTPIPNYSIPKMIQRVREMHKIVFLVACSTATGSITILIRTNLRASNNQNKHNNSTIKKCDIFNSQLHLAMQCLILAPLPNSLTVHCFLTSICCTSPSVTVSS